MPERLTGILATLTIEHARLRARPSPGQPKALAARAARKDTEYQAFLSKLVRSNDQAGARRSRRA